MISRERSEWILPLLESVVVAACVDLVVELFRIWRYRDRDELEREKARLEVVKMRKELAEDGKCT